MRRREKKKTYFFVYLSAELFCENFWEKVLYYDWVLFSPLGLSFDLDVKPNTLCDLFAVCADMDFVLGSSART